MPFVTFGAAVVALVAIIEMITAAMERRAGGRLVAEMRMWEPEPTVLAPYRLKRPA
jgi:hypothetical protein